MKKKHTFNILIIALAILLGFLLQITVFDKTNQEKSSKEPKETVEAAQKKTTSKPKVVPIKESASLTVPYTVQAPLVNWNIHEESCEEAALLMVHYFLSGSKIAIIPPATANQELINMVNWEKINYGREKDLNLYEVGKLAHDYYGYKYRVTEDITAINIKKAISEGSPVLVPVITHALRNSHYGPNPSYHILVIKGYNANGIITNDAGVKEGKDYFYTWDILWSAIDAQTTQMDQGRDMLVVSK